VTGRNLLDVDGLVAGSIPKWRTSAPPRSATTWTSAVSALAQLLLQHFGGILMSAITTTRRPGAHEAERIGPCWAAGLLLGACGDLDIANTNAPTVETLTGSPTRAIIARAATGIFAQAFNDIGTEIQFYALYGREGYNLLGNDPRETGEQIRGRRIRRPQLGHLDRVRTRRSARSTRTWRRCPNATGLNEAEMRASAGFAKTVKAWHIHRLAVRTGELGIPIDVDRPITAEPAPFVSFAAAMAAARADGRGPRRPAGRRRRVPVHGGAGLHRLQHAGHVRAVQPCARGEDPGAPGDVRELHDVLGAGEHGAERVVRDDAGLPDHWPRACTTRTRRRPASRPIRYRSR
jgi:hypothetical protein